MADQQAGSSDAAQIEFWNSAASRAWADQHERMDRAVAEVTKAPLDLAGPQQSHAVNKGRRYRYYVSAALITDAGTDRAQGWRLPAPLP